MADRTPSAATGSREELELALRSLLDDDDAVSAAQIMVEEGWRPPDPTEYAEAERLIAVEIVAPFVRLGVSGDEGSINLDQDTARSLYVMAWERFEKALIAANVIYNEEPATEQVYKHNRVSRLLWETTDLKQAIEIIYSMTALPEDDGADDA
jgi:hypothetical protein